MSRERNLPLYERIERVTPKFEHERCPETVIAKRQMEKSEHQRRIEAIARNEKHIVQPSRVWLRAELKQYLQKSLPRAQPTLRPELPGRYTNDRSTFLKEQAGADANARLMNDLVGKRDKAVEQRAQTRTLREELAALNPERGRAPLDDIQRRTERLRDKARENFNDATDAYRKQVRSKTKNEYRERRVIRRRDQ